MCQKNMVDEFQDLSLAIELISLGARLQLLETETSLSRGKLTKLYRELRGASPPKGMLPFSSDWYMIWDNNIHASVFYNIYRILIGSYQCKPINAIITAYKLYLEQCPAQSEQSAPLSLMRAWTLVRFYESNIVQLTPCKKCGGDFITHAYEPEENFVCVICQPPSRATRKRATVEVQQNEPVFSQAC